MRSRAISEWLRNHEPIVQLLFRVAVLAVLLLAVGQFRALETTFEEINARLVELRVELTNLQSDAEEAQDDAKPAILEIDTRGRVSEVPYPPCPRSSL